MPFDNTLISLGTPKKNRMIHMETIVIPGYDPGSTQRTQVFQEAFFRFCLFEADPRISASGGFRGWQSYFL